MYCNVLLYLVIFLVYAYLNVEIIFVKLQLTKNWNK